MAIVVAHGAAMAQEQASMPATLEAISPGGSDQQCWARHPAPAGPSSQDQITELAFRVPCPQQITPTLIATLQRALRARGIYDGPVKGVEDQATRHALQAFQRSNGFDSPILTLKAAEALGLLGYDLAQN